MTAGRLLLCICCILTFGSCAEDEMGQFNTCQVHNPAEELGWLRASIAELENNKDEIYPFRYILQAVYNQQTVFIFGNCCPYCNTNAPVFDCEGKFLFNRYDEDRADRLTNENVIWQAQNCECNFL